jgi:hypothetical protein
MMTTRLLAAVVLSSAFGCDTSVQPDLTDGEQIRLLLDTGLDEAILFSSALLSDQTGTTAYSRTIDSVKRGFVNPRFYDDNVELQSQVLAFEASILDTLFGTVSYRVGGGVETYPYTLLAYGGNAKFLKIGSTSTHPSAWYVWRMQYRHAEKGAGDGSPSIQTATVSSGGVTRPIATPINVRLFRDSVLTVPPATLTDVDVTVVVDTPDDSFFVTYPVAGGYETRALAHDSLTHTATVQVSSGNRFELLAVQGFKREAFTQPAYPEAAATAIRAAAIRFAAP